MADSSAKVPGASPGARMKVLARMFIVAASTCRNAVSVAYAAWVPAMNGSGMLLWSVIATTPVWMMEVNRPSGSAPIATRCSVSVRPPTTR